MKEFSPVAAPVMTFYSRPFYKDLALNGKGMGFIYLFLLLLICQTAVCIRTYYTVDTGCRDPECAAFVEQIPNMSWTDAKLSIDKPCPYTITGKGSPLIVFDTSGKMKSLSDAGPAQMLITADGFIAKKAEGTEESVPWKQFITKDIKFGPGMIKEFLSKMPLYITVFLWCLGIFVWIGHMFVAFMLGLAGLIMDRSKLGYGTAVRLSSFAMTPVIIISTLLQLTQVNAGMIWPLLSILVSIGFLYLAYSGVNQEA
jgi:hypothetical protein